MAPVVDDGLLVGIVTPLGLVRSSIYRPALDANGKLRIAAAIGINGDVVVKARTLLDAGVDTLVIDTDHGPSGSMFGPTAGFVIPGMLR